MEARHLRCNCSIQRQVHSLRLTRHRLPLRPLPSPPCPYQVRRMAYLVHKVQVLRQARQSMALVRCLVVPLVPLAVATAAEGMIMDMAAVMEQDPMAQTDRSPVVAAKDHLRWLSR